MILKFLVHINVLKCLDIDAGVLESLEVVNNTGPGRSLFYTMEDAVMLISNLTKVSSHIACIFCFDVTNTCRCVCTGRLCDISIKSVQ
jgi:hypothetical protein